MRGLLAGLDKVFHPHKWILIFLPPVVFVALIIILQRGTTENMLAYMVYVMSAYALGIWAAALPKLIKQLRSAASNSVFVRKLSEHKLFGRYLNDLAFRGNVSIYQGMMVNFFYVIFRIVVGIRYVSVWFISMAVYYLVLGELRAFLILGYRSQNAETERRCYRKTAWLLFLLNIPMGGMIVLMIRTNSGFSYPGYIIYLSALYTFYTMVTAVINLVKFRKIGNPILSAGKVLNFVSAMMSVLGLQTAMISRFSENGEGYRIMMNTITGGFVYGIVIIVAVYMLLHSRKNREVNTGEQIRK